MYAKPVPNDTHHFFHYQLSKEFTFQSDSLHASLSRVHIIGTEKIIDGSKFEVTNENFVLASIDVDGDDLNVCKSLGKYKPIILIVEPNGNLIEKINPEGWTIKELVDWGSGFGYEFIGTSGHVGGSPKMLGKS